MESLSSTLGRLVQVHVRLAGMAVTVLAAALGAGCFDSPRPNCAFTCVQSTECPDGYVCTGDGRCHLMTATGPATCDDGVPPLFDAGDNVDVDAAPMIDAAPGTPDAAIPVTDHSGTISVTDTSVQGHPEVGHGLSLTVDLTPLDPVPTVVDTMPGSPLGCKVRVYDVTMGQFPPVSDANHGVVTITGAARPIPPCAFIVGRGYLCAAGMGAAGAGDMIVKNAGGAGTSGWVDVAPAAYTFTANDVGRYISIAGAGGTNDGAFPIVAVDTGTNTAIYGNPGAVSDTTLTGAGITVVAGLGPVPGAPPPEPLADGDTLNVSIAPVSGEFSFPATNVGVGDAFALDAATQAAMTDLPLDGMPLTLRCDTVGGSCASGSALGSIVVIQTTDGVVVPGLPDFIMPTPASKIVVARCAAFDTKIDIPASVMAQIQNAGASRIRTTYLRVNFNPVTNDDQTNPVNIVAGHAIAGFTTDVSCVTPADCGMNTECLTRTCVGNVCGATMTPDNTALATQVAGDCKTLQCDGMGGIETVTAGADKPVDDLDCTSDLCTGPTPSNPPVMMGLTCDDGGGSVCNGGGACVDCNSPADCPATGSVCQTATCLMNACGIDNVADGTPVGTQVTGDCKQQQCDGMGAQENANLDSDVNVDANQCTENICTAGTATNPNSMAGAVCTQSGGAVCDGDGNCVECVSNAQCMAPTPFCGAAETCVECLVNGDCDEKAGEVCTAGVCSLT